MLSGRTLIKPRGTRIFPSGLLILVEADLANDNAEEANRAFYYQ